EEVIGQTLAVYSLGAVAVVLTMSRFMDRMKLRGFSMVGALALGVGLLGTAPFLARHSSAVERPFLFGVSTALSPFAGLLATLGIKAGAQAWGENLAT